MLLEIGNCQIPDDSLFQSPDPRQVEKPGHRGPPGKRRSGLRNGAPDENPPHPPLPQVSPKNTPFDLLSICLRKWIELNGTASQKALVVSGAPKPAPGNEEPSRPEKPKPMFPVYNRSHGNFMNEYELPK